jgi:hypothetical protein
MPGHTESFTFKTGFVEHKDSVCFVTQIDALAEAGCEDSSLLVLTPSSSGWRSAHVQWPAIRVYVSPTPDARLFMLGVGGEVLEAVEGASRSESMIDPGPGGVKSRGPMCDLRWIGGHLYAAGMNRQVYRREGPGRWSRADAGTVQPLGSMTVAGFNAIDGLSEDDFYGVGFEGEIWRRQAGRWRQLDSPTNVVLTRVRAVKPDLAYAVGQRGVLLRGCGDAWEVVDHGMTEEDFWGLEWFQEKVYMSSTKAVYRLKSDEELDLLDTVDMRLGRNRTCYDLHANDDVLWSVGPKHLSWTDGTRWNDVTS